MVLQKPRCSRFGRLLLPLYEPQVGEHHDGIKDAAQLVTVELNAAVHPSAEAAEAVDVALRLGPLAKGQNVVEHGALAILNVEGCERGHICGPRTRQGGLRRPDQGVRASRLGERPEAAATGPMRGMVLTALFLFDVQSPFQGLNDIRKVRVPTLDLFEVPEDRLVGVRDGTSAAIKGEGAMDRSVAGRPASRVPPGQGSGRAPAPRAHRANRWNRLPARRRGEASDSESQAVGSAPCCPLLCEKSEKSWPDQIASSTRTRAVLPGAS